MAELGIGGNTPVNSFHDATEHHQLLQEYLFIDEEFLFECLFAIGKPLNFSLCQLDRRNNAQRIVQYYPILPVTFSAECGWDSLAGRDPKGSQGEMHHLCCGMNTIIK
jgi:hypothetical protein